MHSLINKCINYIETYLTTTISLDDLSSYTNYSKYYISRVFNEVTSYSISLYIEKRRLSKSILLLENKQLKIEDIAYECGFSSLKYYSKKFKMNFGVTPSYYRHNNYFIPLFDKLTFKEGNHMTYIDKETLINDLLQQCTNEEQLIHFISKVEETLLISVNNSVVIIYTIINNELYECSIDFITRKTKNVLVYSPISIDTTIHNLQLLDNELSFDITKHSITEKVETYKPERQKIGIDANYTNIKYTVTSKEIELLQTFEKPLASALTNLTNDILSCKHTEELNTILNQYQRFEFVCTASFNKEYSYLAIFKDNSFIIPYSLYIDFNHNVVNFFMLEYIPLRNKTYTIKQNGSKVIVEFTKDSFITYQNCINSQPIYFVALPSGITGFGKF